MGYRIFEAECLRIVFSLNRNIAVAMEQPAQSWGFKLPFMASFISTMQMHHVFVGLFFVFCFFL